MTKNSEEFTALVVERLQPLGRVSSARFFGGAGISCAGVQFAILMGNALYLVSDDDLRTLLTKLGGEPFSYTTKNRRVIVKRYCRAPAAILEDEEQLLAFARRSIDIARGRATGERIAAARPRRRIR
jgi:DNA transformation protein